MKFREVEVDVIDDALVSDITGVAAMEKDWLTCVAAL